MPEMTYEEHQAKCIEQFGYKPSNVMAMIYYKAFSDCSHAGYDEVEREFDALSDWVISLYLTANMRFNPDTLD